ncbi:uncharacterized protein JCM6883_005368 [Sporobolomyces salmoneus]|uniref:uncharacterized protein n=1 Tax=Sporobolomyces salmoneus TaxID=183962 RepID=UPI003178443C
MPPKRKAEETAEGWAPTAKRPTLGSIQPPKAIPPIDPALAKEFKRVEKIPRRTRKLEDRRIYVRHQAYGKRYERWNGGNQKNIREDLNDPSILHSPICKDGGEESDAYNNTYGFQWKCTMCKAIQNDSNPKRSDQLKASKAVYNERQKTGEKPEYKTDVMSKPDGVPVKGEENWRHPRVDPDGSIPLPRNFPRFGEDSDSTPIPFDLDNPRTVSNYRYVVRVMDKYGVQVDWPTKVYNSECHRCGQALDASKGDRVVASKHGPRLYLKFGTSIGGVKEGLCWDCETIFDIADGILARNNDHEERLNVSLSQRLSTRMPDYHERVLSGFSLILSLPNTDGRAAGSDLFKPRIDVTDKTIVRRQITKLLDTKCRISGQKVRLHADGIREHDKISIDRVHSDKQYSHRQQILQVTGWGWNIMMGNMGEEDRKTLLTQVSNPDGDLANVLCGIQLNALNPSSSFAHNDSQLNSFSLLPHLKSKGWNKDEAERIWIDRMKVIFRLQNKREFVDGRPGKVRITAGGTKVLDRMAWGPDGSSSEEHLRIAKKLYVAAGTLCAVTGYKFVEAGATGGSGWGLDGQCDRIFDSGLYEPKNTWIICGGINKFKSTLLPFRTQEAWNDLLATRPDLQDLQNRHGLLVTAGHYIREELQK